MSLAAQGELVAATIEGEAAVVIARCCRGSSGGVELQEVARVAATGVALPCHIHWSSADEFWIVGCASTENHGAVAAGCVHQSGALPSAAPCAHAPCA